MVPDTDSTTAIPTTSVLLVPYDAHHVSTYHHWMQDPEIQATTASEPLSLEEEHSMQQSWREDCDKLTFIACLPLPPSHLSASPGDQRTVKAGVDDAPDRMIGDVNLFLTPADEDDEGCIGELELMIAPSEHRRQGYGRATVLVFMTYLQQNLPGILAEYAGIGHQEQGKDQMQQQGRMKMKLLQLKVKIGSKNEKSIGLFESLGFVSVGEGENYFGEVELVFEGWLGKGNLEELKGKYGVRDYQEVEYLRGQFSTDSNSDENNHVQDHVVPTVPKGLK
jgi:RimJ/RimL family protein N-acetyltransferase